MIYEGKLRCFHCQIILQWIVICVIWDVFFPYDEKTLEWKEEEEEKAVYRFYHQAKKRKEENCVRKREKTLNLLFMVCLIVSSSENAFFSNYLLKLISDLTFDLHNMRKATWRVNLCKSQSLYRFAPTWGLECLR